MDIRQAKQQIKNAMTAYFTKDELGQLPSFPFERQRPVFLHRRAGNRQNRHHGADRPGAGRRGFVSYSMTHHTRQSALGLPFISHKVYDGVEYDISEYTMSEIIASVYDMMESTGKREGILCSWTRSTAFLKR